MLEYPKALYLKGWDDLDASVTVNDAESEAAARAQGYKSLAEEVKEVSEIDAIRAQLDEKGIAYDRRWGAENLKALL